MRSHRTKIGSSGKHLSGVDRAAIILVEKVALIVYIIVLLSAFVLGGRREGWSALVGGAVVIASFNASAFLLWRAVSSARMRWLYLLLASLKYLLLILVCGWILYRGLVQPVGFIAGTLVIFVAISVFGVIWSVSRPKAEKEDTDGSEALIGDG
ncbi:MAG TPA: hypothetical protein ENF73_05605 [Proteobacteria bacterium]|nr:hypothetical protein [Pseudomonadota bacterium]